MKKDIKIICSFAIVLLFLAFVQAEDRVKLAQTGMQFLSVPTDARAAALGRSVTTVQMGSASAFFNPSGMAGQSAFIDISISRNNWIADIYHNSLAISLAPVKGKYGVFGVSFLSVDYGEVQGAIRADTEKGYMKTEILRPTAYSLGFSYAKTLTDKFSIGGSVKIVHQNLGQSVMSVTDSSIIKSNQEVTPVAFDFGTIFKTGFKSLKFGMFVRNFSTEVKYVSENFQLPLEFSFGISMDAMDFIGSSQKHKLLMTIDAVHYRSHREQLNLGLEYSFRHMVMLRFGYRSGNDENNVNFGIGLQYSGFAIDYAYTPFGVFNDVQRFTFRFSL